MVKYSVRFRPAGDARTASTGGVDGVAFLIATDQEGQEWVGRWLGINTPMDMTAMEIYAESYQLSYPNRVPEGFKPVVRN